MSFFNKRQQATAVLILVYAALIAWLCLTPGVESEPWFPQADKVTHFGAYLVFILLCLPFTNKSSSLCYCALSIFFYSLLIEVGQAFVPLRDMSFLDALANASGILAGVFLTLKFRTRS